MLQIGFCAYILVALFFILLPEKHLESLLDWCYNIAYNQARKDDRDA